MKMPKKWPFYSEACIKEVSALLREGGSLSAYRANKDWGTGPKEGSQAYRLEREIEKKFNVKHAVACNSGTAALFLALKAIGIEGKEVITSPYTFSATPAAIIHAGGTPIFADVDPDNFCITAETVKPYVNKKTAAILPVHLFGYFQELTELLSLGVPVVEDACQAVGAVRGNAYAGCVGAAGAYSFNGGKNVPAGEGGCLATNDNGFAGEARTLLNHAENFGESYVGYNGRIQEVVACIARHGLKELDKRNEHRRSLVYDFRGRTGRHGALVANYSKGPEHVFYVFPEVFNASYYGVHREGFCHDARLRGVDVTGGYITPPLHHYRAFRGFANRPLPIVDWLSFNSLVLFNGFTPGATPKDVRGWAKTTSNLFDSRI